jgi:glycosyltransferase involved in cell wall biosynthesis
MKVAIILPRGMQFSPQGATSIDIVARDLLLKSRYRSTSYVVGADTAAPFQDVDFRPVLASSQAQMVRGILDQLKADLPDIVVVHQHPETAARLAKALIGIPVVLHRHGLLKEARGFFSKWRKTKLFSDLAGLIFVSGFIRGRFLEHYPALAPRSHTVFNGVDTDAWSPSPKKRLEIVYVGRAREDKGIRPLIHAFKAVAPAHWKLKLILGVQTDAEKSFAAEVGMLCAGSDLITILQNEQSASVQTHLAEASIAALPSIVREGFPRAVVEAMACGCATIATRQGGTPEAAGDAAILLDDPQAADFETRLQNALAQLITDQDQRSTLSIAARKRVVDHLGLTSVARRYDDLLTQLQSS